MKRNLLLKYIISLILILIYLFTIGCSSSPEPYPPLPGEDELSRENFKDKGETGEDLSEEKDISQEQKREDKEREEDKENKEEVEDAGEAGKGEKEEVIKEDKRNQEKDSRPTPAGPPEDKKEIKDTGKTTASIAIKGPREMGVILGKTTVEFEEGDTVMEVLQRVTRDNHIQIEIRGRGRGAYVEGINNLYEFDKGPESGWMYSVNGYFPNRGAGAWQVEGGDHIEWHYTKDLGRDLGVGPGGGIPKDEND